MDEQGRPGDAAVPPQASEAARVAEAVTRVLQATGRFSSRRVEVSSADGVVRLRGKVASYYQKQMAQAAALSVIGTRRLVNDIEVE